MVEPPRTGIGHAHIVFPGALDGFPLNAAVVDEPGILSGHDGAFQVHAYLVVRDPFLDNPCIGLLSLQLGQGAAHKGAGAGVVKLQPYNYHEQAKLVQQESEKTCQ